MRASEVNPTGGNICAGRFWRFSDTLSPIGLILSLRRTTFFLYRGLRLTNEVMRHSVFGGWRAFGFGFVFLTMLVTLSYCKGSNGEDLLGDDSLPIAHAGMDRSYHVMDMVVLDGTGSHDPNGKSLRYQWTQTGGPPISLVQARTSTASFIAPGAPGVLTFELPAGSLLLIQTIQRKNLSKYRLPARQNTSPSLVTTPTLLMVRKGL